MYPTDFRRAHHTAGISSNKTSSGGENFPWDQVLALSREWRNKAVHGCNVDSFPHSLPDSQLSIILILADFHPKTAQPAQPSRSPSRSTAAVCCAGSLAKRRAKRSANSGLGEFELFDGKKIPSCPTRWASKTIVSFTIGICSTWSYDYGRKGNTRWTSTILW